MSDQQFNSLLENLSNFPLLQNLYLNLQYYIIYEKNLQIIYKLNIFFNNRNNNITDIINLSSLPGSLENLDIILKNNNLNNVNFIFSLNKLASL